MLCQIATSGPLGGGYRRQRPIAVIGAATRAGLPT